MTRLLGPPLIKARRQIPATGRLGVLIEYSCRVYKNNLIKSAVQRFTIEVFHDKTLIKTNAIANFHFGCRGSDPETFFSIGKLHVCITRCIERGKNFSLVIWCACSCARYTRACLFGKYMNGA